MCIFLFLKCCNFIKGNVCIYIVFLTKLRLIVFIINLLTCSNIYNKTDVSFLKQVNNYVWKNNCPNFYTLLKAPRKSESSFSHSFLAPFHFLVMQQISSFFKNRFVLKKLVRSFKFSSIGCAIC